MVAKDIDISMFLNGLDLETTNGNYDDDENDPNKMNFAGAGCSTTTKAFDEDLFDGEEDLDDIDDEEADESSEDENGDRRKQEA